MPFANKEICLFGPLLSFLALPDGPPIPGFCLVQQHQEGGRNEHQVNDNQDDDAQSDTRRARRESVLRQCIVPAAGLCRGRRTILKCQAAKFVGSKADERVVHWGNVLYPTEPPGRRLRVGVEAGEEEEGEDDDGQDGRGVSNVAKD